MANVDVVKSEALSDNYDIRYVVVDKDTGEVLDNAQGYGYKTVQAAYKAWAYKTSDRSKDKEKNRKSQQLKAWMKQHKGFIEAMDIYAFEIAKGSWGPEDKFDAAFVKRMLKDYELTPDFTAGELLKVWRNYR